MSTAYIIKNDSLIAIIDTEAKNGTEVKYAFLRTKNALDANRDYDLVNASDAKISRAKKWGSMRCECFGSEINPFEYFVS